MKLLNPVRCLCYRPRKSTQHIMTLKLHQKYTLSSELPTHQHTIAVFTMRHTSTRCLSSNHYSYTARKSAASSPASSTVNQCQRAAAVKPLHLPPIGPVQDHCCKQFKGPFKKNGEKTMKFWPSPKIKNLKKMKLRL